jgi:ABC-type dipeptide/oligopeptide/nickel transport system permease subunit
MTIVAQEKVKTPFYYVKKRFLNNKPAVFGLAVIILCVVIALLGNLIMPDHTPNVNDSAVQIKKRPIGFSVTMLRIRKNMEVPQVNIFEHIFVGQESSYTITPIESYRIDGLDVYVKELNGGEKEKKVSMVNAVLPLFIGDSPKLGGKNYEVAGETVRYLDVNEQLHTISRSALTERFKQECIQPRNYILGTDMAGRDMLSRLLYGVRISLSIGFVVGVSMGSLAGYFGGKIDSFILWLMTVVWSIPSIMLVIAISMALQSKGLWVVFVAVGLTSWVEIARVVRGQIMSVKQKLYVEAARSLGINNQRIVFYHILPNILGPLIVIITSNFASAILTEAGLSFLGLGVQPPMPSWGTMINEGFYTIGTKDSWHLVFLPSFCISMLVLAFNLFGNGLRDAYDPTTLK